MRKPLSLRPERDDSGDPPIIYHFARLFLLLLLVAGLLWLDAWGWVSVAGCLWLGVCGWVSVDGCL